VSVPPCPADVTNHGQYVSGVAHSTPPGPDHGQVVSAAAQSDCGKSGSTTSETDPPKTSSIQGPSTTHHGNRGTKGQGTGSGKGKGNH